MAEGTVAESLIDPSPRTLPGTDLRVGPVGFGTWRFVHDRVKHARAVLEAAIAAGMNLVDTADVYGLDWGGQGFGQVEILLGKVLADSPSLRTSIVLATKGGIRPPVPYNSSEDYLRRACDDSLQRLGVDTIDLYQVHRPDRLTHPHDLARTLEQLVASGKVRSVGLSNYPPSFAQALASALSIPLATRQPEYSLLHPDPFFDGTFDQCQEHGSVPLVWSPLAGGTLADVHDPRVRPELRTQLSSLADREGVTPTVIALAFTLAHPSRPVALVGSQNPDRLRDAATATNVNLDRADVYALLAAARGEPWP